MSASDPRIPTPGQTGRKVNILKPQLWKAVALSALALVTPVAANAQTVSSGPIQLDGVQFTPVIGGEDDVGGDYGVPFGKATVAFTNLASQPATDVILSLRDPHGRVLDFANDSGTFSPGTVIRYSFPTRYADGSVHAEIDQATFADGSTWYPDQPAVSRRQAVGEAEH
jgi:hypothetical protein